MAGRWKRGIVLLLTAIMILSVAGCGPEKEEPEQPQQTEQPEQETVTEQEIEPSQPFTSPAVIFIHVVFPLPFGPSRP